VITKTMMKSAFLVLSVVLAQNAAAKTDIDEKIEQLKINTENSKVNLKQYEDNLGTVIMNLAETDKALKSLEKEKQALAKQTAETQKGKNGVDTVKKQLDGLIATESEKLRVEQKQIEDLKKALATAENNAQKRQENIAEYQTKRAKVDTELASWSERNQSIIELEQALTAKYTQAKTDNQRLTAKRATYEEEISKWKKQVRVSERDYQNFSKLKD